MLSFGMNTLPSFSFPAPSGEEAEEESLAIGNAFATHLEV